MPRRAESVFEQMSLRPTFLMVGTVEPRKGHELVLNAFEWLWSQDHALNLIVVGKRGWLVDELTCRLRDCSERGRRVFWLETASDELLEEVYARSTCLLAASEAEGFGLPLIEASFMACRWWRVTFLSLGRLLETRRLILLLVTIGAWR